MRPYSITVLCILLFIMGASQALRALFSFGYSPGFGSGLGLLISLLALYSYWGLWRMKRWSVFLFTGIAVIYFLMVTLFPPADSLRSEIRSWISIVLVGVYWIVVLPHWNRLGAPPQRADED